MYFSFIRLLKIAGLLVYVFLFHNCMRVHVHHKCTSKIGSVLYRTMVVFYFYLYRAVLPYFVCRCTVQLAKAGLNSAWHLK